MKKMKDPTCKKPNRPNKPNNLNQRLRRRLDTMEKNAPQLRLPKFVERVNELAEKFVPVAPATDGRVNEEFNGRKVRHYQTKEIIDAPEREGKEALYGYRHILQALLLRQLLAGGFPANKIREMMDDKPNRALRRLVVQGLDVALTPSDETAAPAAEAKPGLARGPWLRIPVAPGLELHMARGFVPPEGPEAHRELMQHIGQELRQTVKRRRARKQG